MALRYAWGELTGCRRTLADDLEGINHVTAMNLQKTVRQLLTPANLRGAIVGPYRSRDRKVVDQLITTWSPA